MKLEQTPFCVATGLLGFSKALEELCQKLVTVHNLDIKDNAKEDKLEFWGESKSCYAVCYGRHFHINNQYDCWIGLDMTPDKVTVSIYFTTKDDQTGQDITDKLKGLKNKAVIYFHMQKDHTVSLKDDYFERFCESFSNQILVNFTAEVFKELEIILK